MSDPRRGATGSLCEPRGDVRAASLDRVLLDWRGAYERVATYLRALGSEPDEADATSRLGLTRALRRESRRPAMADAMDELEDALLARHPLPSVPDAGRSPAFLRWRLAAWRAGRVSAAPMPAPEAPAPTPPLLRGAMTPERFRGRRVGEWRRRRRSPSAEPAERDRAERLGFRVAWARRGRRRRALLALLVAGPSALAGVAFLGTLPARVWLPAEISLALFFGALFGWISLGFWTAVLGFALRWRGGDRFRISGGVEPASAAGSPFRTAVVMPVCDEPVERVFAGLRAMRESLRRTGDAGDFDWFVLSDSGAADLCADEVAAWSEWRRGEPEDAGIWYRRRRARQKRKSGNVADFCRRFGRRYRYMVVLDADSLVSGEALRALVRAMESHPRVGIIQTAPVVFRARTLFARIQQFASRLYGPMFAAGLHYWYLGDSPYWGHNAILRVAPFMRHCALPRLPGRPPWGGEILSHDFVEAALLGRSGWSVWLAYDLPGSFEETPASLLEEMRRDQRWCQGNLQHLRLLFTEGIVSAHRGLFLNGVFSYVSAVLWLGFLAASTVEAAVWALHGPDYFATGRALFPTWPVWQPERVTALFAVVATVLLLPKGLAVVLALREERGAAFGGPRALLRGVLLESLAGALLAPIRMAFYCRFVVLNLLGRAVVWGGGADEQGETSWLRAWRHHGFDTAAAGAWALGVYWLHPGAFWWLAPVAGALVLSVPLSALASRESLGRRLRQAGWLTVPEERQPADEIRDLEARLDSPSTARWTGFRGAVVDPLRNAVLVALSRGARSRSPRSRRARHALVERALREGPGSLDDREKRWLLVDGTALLELHERVWRLDDPATAARWDV